MGFAELSTAMQGGILLLFWGVALPSLKAKAYTHLWYDSVLGLHECPFLLS